MSVVAIMNVVALASYYMILSTSLSSNPPSTVGNQDDLVQIKIVVLNLKSFNLHQLSALLVNLIFLNYFLVYCNL